MFQSDSAAVPPCLERRRLLGSLMLAGLLAAGHTRAAQARPWRIAAVTYRGRTAVDRGFEDWFAARRIAVSITWFDLARDPARLPAITAAIRHGQPDLIYTWGTTVSLGVLGGVDAVDPLRHVTGIPAVFTLVADPVGARLVRSLAAPGRALTGVSHLAPLALQLRAMSAYQPFTHVGVLYSAAEENSRLVLDQLRELARVQGFALTACSLPLAREGTPGALTAAELLAPLQAAGVQWLYLPPDSGLTARAATLLPEALALGLPSFASTEALVKAGAVAGLVAPYESVGQFTGFKAEQILVGARAPETIAVETLSRFSLQINLPVARRLGLPPPLAMLEYAELLDAAVPGAAP